MEETQNKTKEERGVLHTIANILGVILCVVFIPLIVLNTVLIVKSYTNPDKLPTVFGVAPVIVLSGSMYPEFYTGDMIFVKETDPSTLQVGDVICYFAEGPESAVTHRIAEIQYQDGEPLFVTKGDANNIEDRIAVTGEMVQGKYMGFYIEGLGNVAVFLQSPGGMILCIVLPIGLIFLWDVIRRLISSRKEKKEAAVEGEKTQAMEEELERLRAQLAQQQEGDASGRAGQDGPGTV